MFSERGSPGGGKRYSAASLGAGSLFAWSDGFDARRVKPQPLQPRVCDLIVDRIESVAQLEVLLLLLRDPARLWTAAQLATELRVADSWTQAQLQELSQQNLAVRDGQGFRYDANAATHATVQELERAYQSHPVAVVTLIYTKPNRTLKSFSDAFKLRKDEAPPPPPPAPASSDDPSNGGQGNG